MDPEASTVILPNFVPVSHVFPAPVAFLKLQFGIVTLMPFLTSRSETSISEEGIDLCWTPGAIPFAKMTCPLYDDGTCVKVGGKFQDTGVSLGSELTVNACLRQCWWNLSFLLYGHGYGV